MHPDAILKALRRELAALDKDAKDFPERVKAIEAQIAANLKLERPAVKPGNPTTLVDHDAVYVAGLKRELERSPGNEKAIKAEISRIEGKIAAGRKGITVDEKPSAAEIEQRKQARTGRKVERATAAPGEQRGDEQAEKKSK